MQLPHIKDVIRQISLEIGEDLLFGEATAQRIRSLGDELQAAAVDSTPEVSSAVAAAVTLLRELAVEGPAESTQAAEFQVCLDGIERLIEEPRLIDDPIVLGFLDERTDSLDELEDFALALESTGSPENLEAIRRIVHSIKGDAGVLSLDDLSALCHGLEDNLEGAPHELAARLTLEATEQMRKWFAQIASGEPTAPVESRSVDNVMTLPEPDTIAEADYELAAEFVTEAQEHLESIDSNLLTLESGNETESVEAVNAVFRSFHTLKGLSGFLNLNVMMGLAHEAEAMLERVRSNASPLTKRMIDVAFQVNDGLKHIVAAVSDSLSTNGPVHPPKNFAILIGALKGTEQQTNDCAHPEVQSAERTQGANLPRELAASTPQPISAVRGTIKVDSSRLDQLVDTIGELVIAEAMVTQCDELPSDGSPRLSGLLSQLDKTTRELQEMAMSLRMVPIRSTFRRMARLARDVSQKLGKQVEFVTRGDDTELDKTVVDVIGDPLVHMVRNAVDHGIEKSAEERERAGKPAVAQIELRAFHQGGCIHVEIEDDGRGLDRDVILAKAQAKGLVQDDPDMLSDAEVYSFIFAPGFSTTEAVTEVSGRGVGLDVVRRNIESLRGRIEIRSNPGFGSVFSIRLPLTLAIIDGMVVRVSQRRYVVPTLSIVRMFRPRPEEITTVLGRGRLLRVGEELVSLHRLDDLFGLERSPTDLTSMSDIDVESAVGNFAFLVDELLGQQQIVIKPLGQSLTELDGFAGGAVMPDGTVGLIIDVAGLVGIARKNPTPLETNRS